MSRRNIVFGLAVLASGCDAAGDVEVLPLPALERPSPEARLGLPEVAGSWRFAGWEVIQGDSASLERTFPSFGELRIETQRLDSIAGVFALGGGPARVVGDIRRNGKLALVTVGAGGPDRFIAGEFERDTLWLELTSVLAPDEWPQNSRAAFVREPVAEPIAWLRGANPQAAAPAPTPAADTVNLAPSTGARTAPRVQPPTQSPVGQGVAPGTPGQVQPPPVSTQPRPAAPAQPRPSAPVQTQPPGGQQTPSQTQPRPQPAAPAPAPAPAAPTPEPDRPEPEPEPEPDRPEPEPEPEPDLPPLLGDPVR